MSDLAEKVKAPAIRFKGFSDAWEQREFGEIVDKYEDPVPTPRDGYERLGIRSHAKGTFHSYVEKGRELETAQMHKVAAGNFIVNITFGWEHAVATTNENDAGKLVSHRFPQFNFREKMVPEFFKYVIVDENFRHHLWLSSPGGAGRNRVLKINEMLYYPMIYPCPKEQAKISSFFRSLDKIITLHQRRHLKLKNVKKAMLEKMFPKNGNNVPEIRFVGFTDAWEQRKVGDYYYFKNGLNKGKEYFGFGIPIVNFTDVFHNRGIKASDLKGKVDLQPSEIANYKVQKGDIFFTRTSETIDEIGYSSVMLDEPKDTVFSGFVLRGRAIGKDPLITNFKQYTFFAGEFRKEMVMKSSMTTRALTSGTAIKQMKFHFPKDKREQNKIGAYFQELDHLITLQQRKYEKLQNLKNACLEKMFV